MSKCFNEVSASDFPQLQNRLMTLFQSYFTGHKVVLTRLAVAVASLMIHGVPDLWPRPVDDQLSLLQSELEGRGLSVLPAFFELLTIVPEEFATQVMPQARKAAVRQSLSDSLPKVLGMIVQLFQTPTIPGEAVRQAVKCLQVRCFCFGAG